MARQCMELRHLQQSDRHLAENAERIGKQEQLVASLDRDGHDTKEAIRLLGLLRGLQEQGIAHRQHILEAHNEAQDRAPAVVSDAKSTTA